LRPHIDLQACIALVDASSFYKIVKFLKAPSSQVRSADLILLNKIDLASAEALAASRAALQEINPAAVVIETQYAQCPLAELDRLRRPRHAAVGEVGEGRPDPVQSMTFRGSGSLSRDAWLAARQKLQAGPLRAKGFVTVEGQVLHIDAGVGFWSETPFPAGPMGDNQLVVVGLEMPQGIDLTGRQDL